jgi:DNA modification methylase
MIQILQGDWVERLRELPETSVHCCVTSPPYWGLRDYGVVGQLGLEKSPQEYVAKLVAGFLEVWRVLRDDGTLWLNLGDSYFGDSPARKASSEAFSKTWNPSDSAGNGGTRRSAAAIGVLRPKNLIGMPWRVAFALQDAGWILRSDIIWHKPKPMPESVTDRPTKSHEYIFLLCKQARYYYDAEAIKEPVMQSSLVRAEAGVKFGGNNLCPDTRLQSGKLWVPKAEGANSRMQKSRDPAHEREYDGKHRSADDHASGRRLLKNVAEARANGGDHDNPFGANRNKRSVWTVATAPYREAHFATFPPDLIKPCILAGCPAGGTVLDPFAGSGTTGQVALELGRSAVLIELNPKYVELIRQRCNVTPGLALA